MNPKALLEVALSKVTMTNFSLPPFGPGKHMGLVIISPAGPPGRRDPFCVICPHH